MTWLWSALTVAILAAVLVFKLLRGSLSEPKDLSKLVSMLQPVNPKSLAQLMSREDDAFLKNALPKQQYRHLRKQRFLVLRCYCRAALRNCDLLQSWGQALQRESDVETRNFGREIASACLQLRPQLWKAIAVAQLGAWLPGVNVDSADISRVYASAGQRLMSRVGPRVTMIRGILEQAFPES